MGGVFSKRSSLPVSNSTILPITNSFVELSSETTADTKTVDHTQYVQADDSTSKDAKSDVESNPNKLTSEGVAGRGNAVAPLNKYLNENGSRDVLYYLEHNSTKRNQIYDKIEAFYHQKLITEFESVIAELIKVYDRCGSKYSIPLDPQIIVEMNLSMSSINTIICQITDNKEFVNKIKDTYGRKFSVVNGFDRSMHLYWSL